MRISIYEATELSDRILRSFGYSADQAAVISDHLLDCELRGLSFSGLARLLSIAERLKVHGRSEKPITLERETAISARLNGEDNIGYLVGKMATDVAIDKAIRSGIALIGANDTWYTGMLSYYAEQATAKDLAVMIFSNTSPWVAPHGGTEARFGTNPVCIGLPADREPVIWDIGTSRIIHAQAVLAQRLGQSLPEGVAFGPDGAATTDPAEALRGAFAPWGGHRGGGLGIIVQMMGMMAGSQMMPEDLRGFGMVIVAMKPDLLTPVETFKHSVAAYADAIRHTKPIDDAHPVRMPFDRSRADRARRRAEGCFDLSEETYTMLRAVPAGI